MNEKTCETPRADLAESARRDYDKASEAVHLWNSVIPEAINAWEREPKLRQGIEYWNDAFNELCRWADDQGLPGVWDKANELLER